MYYNMILGVDNIRIKRDHHRFIMGFHAISKESHTDLTFQGPYKGDLSVFVHLNYFIDESILGTHYFLRVKPQEIVLGKIV